MDQSKIFELSNRIRQAKGQQLNEAMTKNSLILPFIQSLGYDIFDPTEVVAEFTADVGIKKGEKVDFAIIREGQPVIMMECKPLGTPLDVGKCGQLYRYFSTHTSARIGILTDGSIYLFFSDLDKQNIMDSRPYMTIDLSDFNDRYLPEIQKISKEKWDIDGALSSAGSLKYVSEIKKNFSDEVATPSDEFIKFFASRVYGGHVTAKVRDQFSSIVKRAIQEYINDQINSRLESAKVEDAPEKEKSEGVEGSQENGGIDTTEDEVMAFLIVQTILRQTIVPSRIIMRDAKSYCAVLVDDNNRKTVCRLHFNGKKKYIGIFGQDKKEEKIPIEGVDDIFGCADKLIAATLAYCSSE